MRRLVRVDLVMALLVLFVAGCGSTTPTPAPTPSRTPPVTPAATALTPSATAVPTDSHPRRRSCVSWARVVVTVSDRLRVRSAPEVSDTSLKYEPLLPLGTELRVIGGPIRASGYVWYDVKPIAFALSDGVDHGWVAMADHDGTPWLALADKPIAGLEVAMSAVSRAHSLELFLPRFRLGTRAELGKALETLGMLLAFDADRADFTGIHSPQSDGDAIHIANVIHQANISVDELGTEAAAATAVGMDTTGGCGGLQPSKQITLRLDHPFLFALRDVDTGAILFMGRVVDPAAAG